MTRRLATTGEGERYRHREERSDAAGQRGRADRAAAMRVRDGRPAALDGRAAKRRLAMTGGHAGDESMVTEAWQCGRGCRSTPSRSAVTKTDLADVYRGYIACLNKQDWAHLGRFVHDDVHRNGQRLGLSGYQRMLEGDFHDIPNLHFNIQLLICDPPCVASRLRFDSTPRGRFLGLPVNGRKVVFTENVFYEVWTGKIEQVWSVIDKGAIEDQL